MQFLNFLEVFHTLPNQGLNCANLENLIVVAFHLNEKISPIYIKCSNNETCYCKSSGRFLLKSAILVNLSLLVCSVKLQFCRVDEWSYLYNYYYDDYLLLLDDGPAVPQKSWWRKSWILCLNLTPHRSQAYGYLFSWTSEICRFNPSRNAKEDPHCVQENGLSLRWTERLCFCRLPTTESDKCENGAMRAKSTIPFSPNDLSHKSQANGFNFWCTVRICLWRSPVCVKRWPHSLHRLRSSGTLMRRVPLPAEAGGWGGEPPERKELFDLREPRELLDPPESPDPLGSDLFPEIVWEAAAGGVWELVGNPDVEGGEDDSLSKKDKSSLVLRRGFGGMLEKDEVRRVWTKIEREIYRQVRTRERKGGRMQCNAMAFGKLAFPENFENSISYRMVRTCIHVARGKGKKLLGEQAYYWDVKLRSVLLRIKSDAAWQRRSLTLDSEV